MAPNYTALTLDQTAGSATATSAIAEKPRVFSVVAAEPGRESVNAYVCTEKTGDRAPALRAYARLPDGTYDVAFVDPAVGNTVGSTKLDSYGIGKPTAMNLPEFADDLAVHIVMTTRSKRSRMANTL